MKNQLKIAILPVAIITILGIANAQDNPDDSMQRVTGCLRKDASNNRYRLLDENGKLWNLQSKNVRFAPHVGHLVAVSDTIPPKIEQ